ncbi:hypothetical protein ACP4OV_019422 [Aristida adscensionis]
MQTSKRDGCDLIRFSKDKRTCNFGGETSEWISGDTHCHTKQDVWGELSDEVALNSSKSVISLAVSNGDTVLFACSGIAIEWQGHVTRFLTSASLVRALNDKSKDHGNLKIEVRHEGNVTEGFLGKYDLEHDIAVVNAMTFVDVQVILLNHVMEYLPYSKVVALGRNISGKLMATNGMLIHDSSGSEDSGDLILSTCKISEALKGGPLFDVEGNFIGLNLFAVQKRTVFLPTNIILERLEHFRLSLSRSKFLARLEKLKAIRTDGLGRSTKKTKRTDNLARSSKKNKRAGDGRGKAPDSFISVQRDELFDDRFWYLDSWGYPKPTKDDLDRHVLVRTFEETFGDKYDEGTWSVFSETASSNISQSVVALASFYGGKRIFSCTGFFIEWNGCTTILTSASFLSQFVNENKIVGNFRIEVLLPNKQCREGTLQHYNLHYNIALVSVKDFYASHPAFLQHGMHKNPSRYISIGRCFKTGTLMAAGGNRMDGLDIHDCKFLKYTTCEITMAGDGGPLVDSIGRFVGINFYDSNITGAPFLLWDVIIDVLAHFKTKRTVAEVGHDGYSSCVLDWTVAGDTSVCLNSWLVPKPCWSIPGHLELRRKALCAKARRIKPSVYMKKARPTAQKPSGQKKVRLTAETPSAAVVC